MSNPLYFKGLDIFHEFNAPVKVPDLFYCCSFVFRLFLLPELYNDSLL